MTAFPFTIVAIEAFHVVARDRSYWNEFKQENRASSERHVLKSGWRAAYTRNFETAIVKVTLADGRQVTGSHILMAVGRKVALDGLNLDAAGIAHTPKGVTVNASLRSSNRRVYAVGDAAGGLQFTHVAGWHAGIVIRQIVLGLPAKADPRAIPRATYTDPELAQVGLTETEAQQAHGSALTVLRADFALDRLRLYIRLGHARGLFTLRQ